MYAHGLSLRATLDVERALHAEEAALVVERAHLGVVEEGAGSPVGNNGAVVPGVPKSAHDVHELGRDLVTQVVLVEALLAEVQGGGIVRARHHVPGGSPAAERVERREG